MISVAKKFKVTKCRHIRISIISICENSIEKLLKSMMKNKEFVIDLVNLRTSQSFEKKRNEDVLCAQAFLRGTSEPILRPMVT